MKTDKKRSARQTETNYKARTPEHDTHTATDSYTSQPQTLSSCLARAWKQASMRGLSSSSCQSGKASRYDAAFLMSSKRSLPSIYALTIDLDIVGAENLDKTKLTTLLLSSARGVSKVMRSSSFSALTKLHTATRSFFVSVRDAHA